jgi:hypothetical protein
LKEEGLEKSLYEWVLKTWDLCFTLKLFCNC